MPHIVGIVGNRNALQDLGDSGVARGVLVQPFLGHQAFLDDEGRQGGEAPRIGARAHGEVVVRHLGGFAAARVDDDHRAVRVLLDLAQDHPCASEAVRLEWVLAQEDGHLGVLEIAMHAGAHHLALHPGFAGLLLRQRIGAVDDAQRLDRAVGIRAAEVVSLAATAVVKDAGAAVPGLDVGQLLGDLADGGRPVDVLVAAVGATTLGAADAVTPVLIEVHALRLLADVALRGGVVLVPSGLHDAPAFGLDLQSAVQRADDASRLLPIRRLGCAHPMPLRCSQTHGGVMR